jgi:hypothetical protein
VILSTRGYEKRRNNKARGFNGITLRGVLVTDGDKSVHSPSPARVSGNGQTRHNPSLRVESRRNEADSLLPPSGTFVAEGEV